MTQSLVWSGNDFITAFAQSIIKKTVALRFTCSNTGVNSVNVGVRYQTLNKSYQVAERQTLFVIPPNGSVEITPASKPWLGLLDPNIISITVDLTAASASTVSVSLTIDDEPPPLSSDPGQFIGLDTRLNDDYIPFAFNSFTGIAIGVNVFNILTVPAGSATKRFFLDFITFTLPPTPVNPGLVQLTLTIAIGGMGTVTRYFSKQYDYYSDIFPQISTPMQTGDTIVATATNNSGVAKEFFLTVFGRETF